MVLQSIPWYPVPAPVQLQGLTEKKLLLRLVARASLLVTTRSSTGIESVHTDISTSRTVPVPVPVQVDVLSTSMEIEMHSAENNPPRPAPGWIRARTTTQCYTQTTVYPFINI